MENPCSLPRLTHEILKNHLSAPQEKLNNILIEKRVHYYIKRYEKNNPLFQIYHRTYVLSFYFDIKIDPDRPRRLTLSTYLQLYSSDRHDLPHQLDLENMGNDSTLDTILDYASEIISPIIIAYSLPPAEKYERYVTSITKRRIYKKQK